MIKSLCGSATIILFIKPPKSPVQDIQVFHGFANFYRRFIQGFSRIAASLTSMLKTSGSTESTIRPGKGGVGVGDDGRAERDGIDDGDGCSDDFNVSFQVIRWRSRHCSCVRKSQ